MLIMMSNHPDKENKCSNKIDWVFNFSNVARPNSKRCVSNPGRKFIVDSFQPSLMRLNLGSLVAYCEINEHATNLNFQKCDGFPMFSHTHIHACIMYTTIMHVDDV